jgi:putative DNA primase/helicase
MKVIEDFIMEDNYNISGSNAPHLNNDEIQDLLSNPQQDECEAHLVDSAIEAIEMAESYNVEEHQTEPDYGNLENEVYEFEDKNDDDPWCGEGKEESNNVESPLVLFQRNTPRVNQNVIKISDRNEVQIILQSYVNSVSYLTVTYWEDLVEEEKAKSVNGKVNINKIYKYGTCELIETYSWNNDWMFCADGDKIYLYNGSYWVYVEIDFIAEFLRNLLSRLGLPNSLSKDIDFINKIYKQLKSFDMYKKMNPLEETLVNFKNGTLKVGLRGIEFLPFNPEHYLTYQLDFEYNGNAINELFLAYLDVVLPDKDTQKTLQQALGYLLIQGLKLEVVTFLYGTGQNGKSVLFEILNGLFGSHLITNHSLESLVQANSYNVAQLNNKLINYASDISMKKMNHGRFKQLASGEPINVRNIYHAPFIMKRYAKLIFNINKIDDADVELTVGFFRRMVFIPFEVLLSDDQKDPDLHKKYY